MIVYHGSTVEVSAPKVLITEVGRDFGPAFYTTDIREQAERWAKRRQRFMSKMGKETRAIVSVYEFDAEGARRELKMKAYPAVSMDWLDMVVKCRSTLSFRHDFDIVSGKIANDSVGETISYVVAGVMPREMALEKLKFQEINNQIAFCNLAALRFIKFVRSYEVEVK